LHPKRPRQSCFSTTVKPRRTQYACVSHPCSRFSVSERRIAQNLAIPLLRLTPSSASRNSPTYSSGSSSVRRSSADSKPRFLDTPDR
jgi:hypothetical protein